LLQTGKKGWMVNIYFCGSIRGGRQLASTYEKIIGMLGEYGQVLTEYLGDDDEITDRDATLSDREIHDRDLKWIMESDLVIAEVTIPSLGVGYEIGRAIEYRKPVLCLYQDSSDEKLSAMIAGSPNVELYHYADAEGLSGPLHRFMSRNAVHRTS